MDTSKHNLATLFAQLGLDNSPDQITQFINKHRIADDMLLAEAPFWNEGQRHFIEESLREDADWCELIDELDAMLR
ncbi:MULTISPECIES: DUF2789 domain-containing protein [Pseudoalteromonas]|uniref:DUF2789 domain-containing protein n=1 Tax=Pseudoalteromonas amylolytica TaxID=1859457 RepID=A0A1S1MLV9_9GAMM|nr:MULTISPECIES: DUF2789 domain-containing protein [Pseudoalteromonas]OHU86723.1 hypothetical protein BFC16_14595 [Pseudoalteromonas sp. JW3]OHU88752.1 hypothetical protein BET10_18160 [Pseudoalteromonas amylolytica]